MKNTFKRAIASILTFTLIGSFAGCAKPEATTAADTGAGSNTQSEAQADVKANVAFRYYRKTQFLRYR